MRIKNDCCCSEHGQTDALYLPDQTQKRKFFPSVPFLAWGLSLAIEIDLDRFSKYKSCLHFMIIDGKIQIQKQTPTRENSDYFVPFLRESPQLCTVRSQARSNYRSSVKNLTTVCSQWWHWNAELYRRRF